MIDGILLVTDGVLTIWKLKATHLSIILLMNLTLFNEMPKSRKVAWLPSCSPSSVGYISKEALLNSKIERCCVLYPEAYWFLLDL